MAESIEQTRERPTPSLLDEFSAPCEPSMIEMSVEYTDAPTTRPEPDAADKMPCPYCGHLLPKDAQSDRNCRRQSERRGSGYTECDSWFGAYLQGTQTGRLFVDGWRCSCRNFRVPGCHRVSRVRDRPLFLLLNSGNASCLRSGRSCRHAERRRRRRVLGLANRYALKRCSRFAVRSAALKSVCSVPPRVSQRRGYNNSLMNLFENFAHPVAKFPSWIMRLKLSHIADPPNVVADAVRFLIGPG